ncbi:MAG: hypothetical protein ACI87C_002194, partial [Paraperlucidibaca sp.]
LSLLQNRHDLAVRVSRYAHVELPQSIRRNSTSESD